MPVNYDTALTFLSNVASSEATPEEITITWSDDGKHERAAARYLTTYIRELEALIVQRAPNPDEVLGRLRKTAATAAEKELS